MRAPRCYNYRMDNTIDIYEEERPWGRFRKFTDNQKSTVKIIYVNPNEELSLQSHKKRKEFWRIIAGAGIVEIGENRYQAKEDDEFKIDVGKRHSLSAGPRGIKVLEISFGDFDEEDIMRYRDKYGRM